MQDIVKYKFEAFFSSYSARRLPKGQILIYGRDEPPGIFYLSAGQIKQYDINEQGHELIVSVYKEPTIFPVEYALNHTPNRYFYESFTDVIVRRAPREYVEQFLKTNPDVVYELLSKVYSGLEDMQIRMAYMMGGSARNRVLVELLLDCKRYGIHMPDGTHILQIHESEIAARTGLTRETVSRQLSAIAAEKHIAVNRKEIIIRDLDLLNKELNNNIS